MVNSKIEGIRYGGRELVQEVRAMVVHLFFLTLLLDLGTRLNAGILQWGGGYLQVRNTGERGKRIEGGAAASSVRGSTGRH